MKKLIIIVIFINVIANIIYAEDSKSSFNIGFAGGILGTQPVADEFYMLPSYNMMVYGEYMLFDNSYLVCRTGYNVSKYDNRYAVVYHDTFTLDVLMKLYNRDLIIESLDLYLLLGIGNCLSLGGKFTQKEYPQFSLEEADFEYSENFETYGLDVVIGIGFAYDIGSGSVFVEVDNRNGVTNQLKKTDNPLFTAKKGYLQSINVLFGYQISFY